VARGTHRSLAKLIKPFGLRLEQGRKHTLVLNAEGHRVYALAATPSCPFALDNALHDLGRLGLVPWEISRHKLRGN
jgi:hypothetical protein